jgi:L-threonylcarbamoyladenylate synthase
VSNMQLITPATPDGIAEAAAKIRAGELVGLPTETVYGLGADATNDTAVAGIFTSKKRPAFNPLIVHVADIDMARRFGVLDDITQALARELWPGPLTLVVPRAESSTASLLVSAGLDTIALRAPDHPVAQQLIREAGRPIAAPSANISGTVSPTTAQHVADSLGDAVSLILDGGSCRVGIESTIVMSDGDGIRLLRPGSVNREILEEVAKVPIHDDAPTGGKPLSPGQLDRHYAPAHAIRLNVAEPRSTEVLLALGPQPSPHCLAALNLSSSGDLREAAANLFAMIRELDQIESDGIAVMPIPEVDLGVAINDRLRRAASQPNEPTQ